MKKLFRCRRKKSKEGEVYAVCENIRDCVDLFKIRYGCYPDVVCLVSDAGQEVLVEESIG